LIARSTKDVQLDELVYEGNESDGVTHGLAQCHTPADLVQAPEATKSGLGVMLRAGLAPGRIPLEAAGEDVRATTIPTRVTIAVTRRATSGALS
jgi:hypothetical protein